MKGKKTGGRTKGTPNKITTLAKDMMTRWLEMHNSTVPGEATTIMMNDFAELEPRDRVKISTEFIKIIMPKNISIDENEVRVTIEDKLRALSGAAESDE